MTMARLDSLSDYPDNTSEELHLKGKALLYDAAESALYGSVTMKLEVTVFPAFRHDNTLIPLRIGLRTGEDKLYVVSPLPDFIGALQTGRCFPFGQRFVFNPAWMRFTKEDMRILHILDGVCAVGYTGDSPRGERTRTLPMPPVFAKQILGHLADSSFRVAIDGKMIPVEGITTAEFPISYELSHARNGYLLKAEHDASIVPLLPDCSYVFINGKVHTLPRYTRAVLPPLLDCGANGEASLFIPKAERTRFFSVLLPFLRLSGTVLPDARLRQKMAVHHLETTIYLDRENRDVLARPLFRYGDETIDPFSPDVPGQVLIRDPAERLVLDALADAGFRVRRSCAYLTGREEIWRFFQSGIHELSRLATVHVSREFGKMKPRKPSLKGMMRLEAGGLNLTFEDEGQPLAESLAILQALAERRQYVRFRDGAFIDLRGLETWQAFAAAAADNAQADQASGDSSSIRLKPFRALYLSAMLKNASLPIQADESVLSAERMLMMPEEFIREGIQVLNALRPYQRRGLRWLLTLYRMGLGGILADEMGLGKTIQIIALLACCAKEEGMKPSVVVCPAGLCRNWREEIQRFAPELSVTVLEGTKARREVSLNRLRSGEAPADVLILSYPTLCRDLEHISAFSFRFAVLDEAQYVKNTRASCAAAVKRLNASARFALTGTPMENNISELWSLFDFVMPGFLPAYPAFLARYAQAANAEDLKLKIRPFMMRRLKTDVLSELPVKREQVLYAEMTPEQERVYNASKLRLSGRVNALLAEKGIRLGQTEILSALMELRRICCHPALCLEGYCDTSGKLELLMDMLPDALGIGRRVLVFSQFTGMLKLIKKRLEAENIHTLYLDGETPPRDRLDLTEAFNQGRGQVFLISLRAGGTGLNLTGADMVIHYDPWWNPAVEDQATDRAHRIGQDRQVEVIRLITTDSIEEQVSGLSDRKRALFDRFITAGETSPDQLTEADILKIFA